MESALAARAIGSWAAAPGSRPGVRRHPPLAPAATPSDRMPAFGRARCRTPHMSHPSASEPPAIAAEVARWKLLLAGRLLGRGEVAWQPVVRWNAVVRGQGINPGQLAAQFPGSLSFAATTRGQMAEAGPVGRVQISRLEGTLRNQPVAATADLRLAGSRHRIDRLDLTWSDAKLAAFVEETASDSPAPSSRTASRARPRHHCGARRSTANRPASPDRGGSGVRTDRASPRRRWGPGTPRRG